MATINSIFLDAFPKIKYEMSPVAQYSFTEEATDIFFRVGMLKDVLKDIAAYYVYEIEEGDTPEIIAEKVYGDSGAGWIIVYANQILDPQFDWPLTDKQLQVYIKNKYGTVEASKTGVHHYEKIVKKTSSNSDYEDIIKFVIDKESLIINSVGRPYNYYDPSKPEELMTADSTLLYSDTTTIRADNARSLNINEGALPFTQFVETINDGTDTITITTFKNFVTYYDYEKELNDNKRFIKVIKKIYYEQLINEFDDFLLKAGGPGIRSYDVSTRRLII